MNSLLSRKCASRINNTVNREFSRNCLQACRLIPHKRKRLEMRIFNSIPDTPQVGVRATVAVGGTHYEVMVDERIVVAKISLDVMKEMVGKGEAVLAPAMSWSQFGVLGKRKGRTGGVTILRADFEIKDGSLWLIPQKNLCPDVLHFMRNVYQQHELICNNAEIVLSIEAPDLACNIHVARLSPGGLIGLCDPDLVPVSPSTEDAGTVINRIVTSLDEDWTNITC